MTVGKSYEKGLRYERVRDSTRKEELLLTSQGST